MKNRKLYWIAAVLTVCLSLFVRFEGLSKQGYFTFDEARYLLETQALSRSLDRAFSGETGDGEPAVYQGMARPLHILFLLFCNSVPGALVAMGAAGVISIGIAGFLAKSLAIDQEDGGWTTVLFTAFFMAFSPSHSFLSRTLLAEVDAVFLFLLGLSVFMARASSAPRFVAGVLFGLAITVQSRLALIVPAVFLWELAVEKRMKCGATMLAGMAIPIAVTEMVFRALKSIAFSNAHPEYMMTYLEQFLHRAATDAGRVAFNRPLFGIEYLAFSESVGVLFLFFAGGAILMRRQSRRGIFLFVLSIWALSAATFYDQINHSGMRWGRALAPAIPLVSIVAGFAASCLSRKAGRRAWIAAIVICAIVFVQRWPLLEEVRVMRADYEDLLDDIVARTPSANMFSDEPLHITYYLADRGTLSVFPIEVDTSTVVTDTTTVVIFNPAYARNFGFWYLLPDTPSFSLPRPGYRAPRLLLQEQTGMTPRTILELPMRPAEAQIFVLPRGYESPVRVRRLF